MGSTTLFKAVFINPEQVVRFFLCKRLNTKLDHLSLNNLIAQGTAVEQVCAQKLLGVLIIVDQSLNFNEHVEQLCKKLSHRIAVLRKIQQYFPIGERILYYNAMIKQTMFYGSTVWNSCSTENINKVFKLQKQVNVARVILEVDTRANLNSVHLFKKPDQIPFYDEAKINKCILVSKCFSGNFLSYFNDIL